MNVCQAVTPGRRIWLVRHGESTWNALGLVQGQAPGSRLTRSGLRQAAACARVLAGEPISSLYASDLARAARTAEVVGDTIGLPVVLDVRLRERSLGSAEGAPSSQLPISHSGVDQGRVTDADAAPPGGESLRELYERVSGFLGEVLAREPTGDVALVCHRGVISVALAWLDGSSPDDMVWPEIQNGSWLARPLPPPHLALGALGVDSRADDPPAFGAAAGAFEGVVAH